jgi:hypothetical protein
MVWRFEDAEDALPARRILVKERIGFLTLIVAIQEAEYMAFVTQPSLPLESQDACIP